MNLRITLIFLFVTTLTYSKRLLSQEDFIGILQDATREVENIQENRKSAPALVPGHGKRGVSKFSKEMERVNAIAKRVTKAIAQIEDISLREASLRRKSLMRSTGNIDICTDEVVSPCTEDEKTSKFRSINGRCNNIANPKWGSAGIPLRRFLASCRREFFTTRDTLLTAVNPPNQSLMNDDSNLSIFREEECTTPAVTPLGIGSCSTVSILPNPQLVSSNFHSEPNLKEMRPVGRLTQLFTTFGQFVDHDITFTSTYDPPDCCADPSDTEQCAPVTVVANDTIFSSGKCLNFVRSLSFCDDGHCSSDPMNAITSFLDASQVYGSDETTMMSLRNASSSRFLSTSSISLMPEINGVFTAGDIRALENPGLASYQTIFLREHNRLARAFSKRFPSWDDETVFQNARRILIAEYQNIIINEFLPPILANRGMEIFFPQGEFNTSYNPKIDATILNEFATAAYRFGHSMVNGRQERRDPMNPGQILLNSYLLRFNFNNQTLYEEKPDFSMNSIVAGMTVQRSQDFDPFLSTDLTRFLNAKQIDNFTFGEDLATRNIQRGRDHGLQSYLSYNNFCNSLYKGPPNATEDWNSLYNLTSKQNVEKLKQIYEKVSDIDLFTGGLAENPVPGGSVGPTFACIIGHQFNKLVAGDRYFFTNMASNGPQFTLDQVKAIKNVKMSDILCANTKVGLVPRFSFRIVDSTNPLIDCRRESRPLDASIF